MSLQNDKHIVNYATTGSHRWRLRLPIFTLTMSGVSCPIFAFAFGVDDSQVGYLALILPLPSLVLAIFVWIKFGIVSKSTNKMSSHIAFAALLMSGGYTVWGVVVFCIMHLFEGLRLH